MRLFLLMVMAAALSGCGGEKPITLDEFHTQDVRLPGGQTVKVEVMLDPKDQLRGMMFRDSLAPDRGMLFVHRVPGTYTYWMYQVKIPLDIIWMDKEKRVVEISANTPPCKTAASACPHFGGHQVAQYVLELGGGMSAKYGIKQGDTLVF